MKFFFLAVFLLWGVAFSGTANAAALNYNADTRIQLSSPEIYLTILSGSGADSLVVGTSTMVISVPSSTVFTLISDSRDLSYTGQTAGAPITLSCANGLSTLSVLSTNTSTQSLTITPTASQCVSAVKTGGTIGGGYTSYVPPIVVATSTPQATTTTPTIASLQAQLKILLAQLLELQTQARARGIAITATLLSPGPLPPEAIPLSGTYRTPLSRRMSSPDVRALQTLLKAQGADIYREGLVTGYFGLLTEQAVQRLQVKYGIATSADPGFGRVGPKTRALLNSLIGR